MRRREKDGDETRSRPVARLVVRLVVRRGLKEGGCQLALSAIMTARSQMALSACRK